MTYSIAIRTLGLSREMFKRELESIALQTIQPERIIVYIAEGYERPEFQIGREEYIWVPKGMVAQRALQYEEITSDYIMLLDDDVELAPDSAAKLLQALVENHADVIGADTFRNQDMSIKGKLFAAVTNWVAPHCDKRWAFKIHRHGGFSYLAHPQRECMPTQYCAGPASMWRREPLLAIHLEDECFLDQLGFALGDDMLEFYKLHVCGYRQMLHYSSGIKHLDAKSSSMAYHGSINKYYVRAKGGFLLWWRTCYESRHAKWLTAVIYTGKVLWLFLVNLLAAVVLCKPQIPLLYIRGIIDAWCYVHSAEYKKIPPYLTHRRPRLLHVITSLRTGGAEKLMVDLLPRLRECGYDAELCVFDSIRTPFTEQLEQAGVMVHGLSHSMYSLANVWRLLPLMRRADIVHTHNTPCQFAAALLAPLCRCRVVTTEHNTSNRRRGKWYWRWMDRMMYHAYQRIICISEKAEENLCSYLALQQKCLTIHNGIDTARFMCAEPTENLLPQTVHKAVMVAAFREQKDHRTLIDAYHHLPEDYHLLLAGSGELEAEVRSYVVREHLEHRVHFLGNRTDVPSILKCSDVVVLCSHYEGLSLACIEGMASGRPFVASDVDGLHDIVQGAGLLCPHGDAESFASAIRRLTEDKAYAAQVAQTCQERAAQYDISKMVDGYHRVYQSL